MELLTGSNGRQLLLLKERLEVPHALDVLIDICHALDAAHRSGVVHQDLKPDNIFIHLDEWTGTAVTKLLDFGVARLFGQGHDGTFEGTLAYAAPEQLRGEAAAPTTDLYALGVIAFELITGRRPFEMAESRDELDRGAQGSSAQVGFFGPADFTHNLVDAILGQPPPRLCDYIRLPRALEELVLQLLDKDPLRRPVSAKAVANVLQSIRQSPSLPKSAVTTQELLLNAAHAPKAPPLKGGTLRMGTLNLGAEGAQEYAATVPDAPLFESTLDPVPPRTVDPIPVVPSGAVARTPAPVRDARALAPVATERLPSAPAHGEVRIETRPGAGRASTAAAVKTLEPVVERRDGTADAGSRGREARSRQIRRVAFAFAVVAGFVLVVGGIVAFRRAPSAPVADTSSVVAAASSPPASPSSEPATSPSPEKEPDAASTTQGSVESPGHPTGSDALAAPPAPAPVPSAPVLAASAPMVTVMPKPHRASLPKAAPSASAPSHPAHESKPRPGPDF
jgi:hypothetical protein